MQQTIWQSIANTSWWSLMFAIFFIIVMYFSTKPKIIPLKQLTVAVLTVFALSLLGIYWFVKPDAHNLSLYAYTLVLGTGLGWLHFSAVRIKGIKEMKQLYVPGTWIIIFLFIGVAIAKYNGLNFSVDRDIFKLVRDQEFLMSFYGFFTGLFLGRWWYGKHVVKFGPFHTVTTPAH